MIAVDGAKLDVDVIEVSVRLSDGRVIPIRIPVAELNDCFDDEGLGFDPDTGLRIHPTVQ